MPEQKRLMGLGCALRETMTRLIAVAMLVRVGWRGEPPAVDVTSAEMGELHRWMAAKFDGGPQAAPAKWGLAVLTNFDELCLNTRMGRPLTLGQTEYPRGVFCHANSKVAVRLPAPGKMFSARVGVDSNAQTLGGRGSIVFSVTVAGREAFRSKVMREGTPAESVRLDLGGATELLLEVGDAGDGNACDQADWAEAKITRWLTAVILWLGDLSIIEGQASPAMSTELPFSFRYGEPVFRRAPPGMAAGSPGQEAGRPADRTDLDLDRSQERAVAALGGYRIPRLSPRSSGRFTSRTAAGRRTPPLSRRSRALDTRFERKPDEVYARFAAPGEFVLNHHVGSPCAA